jgi:transposase
MPQGKAISDDLREVLLHMAQFLDLTSIAHYTGCKRCTMERILSDYRRNGTVKQKAKIRLQGRRRLMKDQDVRVSRTVFIRSVFILFIQCNAVIIPIQFLQGLVHHAPDAYLDEMQELLEARRGVAVAKSTVWRALMRTGFTMKKVSCCTVFITCCG